MLFAEGIVAKSLEKDREPSLDPNGSLSSRTEVNQSLGGQSSQLSFQGHITIVATEKGFKGEKPIYVSFFFLLSLIKMIVIFLS